MVDKNKGAVVSTTQKLSQDYELISTCYHEAGHTLIGLLRFMKIPAVTVNYTAKSVEGFTHYEMCDQEIDDEKINNYLLMSEIYISYAGLVAEKIHYKDICGADKLPMVLKEGSSPDILSAADIIRRNNVAAPGKKRQLFKQKIYKELAIDLKKHWQEIKLISHALYKRKRLDWEDLEDLLIKKSTNKKFWKERFKEIAILVDSPEELDEKEIRSYLFK